MPGWSNIEFKQDGYMKAKHAVTLAQHHLFSAYLYVSGEHSGSAPRASSVPLPPVSCSFLCHCVFSWFLYDRHLLLFCFIKIFAVAAQSWLPSAADFPPEYLRWETGCARGSLCIPIRTASNTRLSLKPGALFILLWVSSHPVCYFSHSNRASDCR